MPYLDSKISDKHKAGCKKPKAKRLYIRDYGDKGQQIFVPWGITCPSCKVIILDEIIKAKAKPSQPKAKAKTKPKRKKAKESFPMEKEKTDMLKAGLKYREQLLRRREVEDDY